MTIYIMPTVCMSDAILGSINQRLKQNKTLPL